MLFCVNPLLFAIDKETGHPLAVGEEAKRMLGRTPGNIVAIRPLKDGVIADFDTTEAMLKHFIEKVSGSRWHFPPRVVIAVPSGITEVEKRAVRDSAERAGARSPVYLIEEPIAAAIGVGLPIQEPGGNMVIDVGGGTTEMAVISLAGVVYSKSIRIGGDECDDAIMQHMRKTYNLLIGERTAENIKVTIGSAYPLPEEMKLEVKGRDILAGLPKTVMISSEEIRSALSEPINSVLEAIRITLEKTPPELSADLVDRGLILAGGGALLRGLDKLISEETGLPVHVADDPLTAIALGTGRALSELNFLRKVSMRGK